MLLAKAQNALMHFQSFPITSCPLYCSSCFAVYSTPPTSLLFAF